MVALEEAIAIDMMTAEAATVVVGMIIVEALVMTIVVMVVGVTVKIMAVAILIVTKVDVMKVTAEDEVTDEAAIMIEITIATTIEVTSAIMTVDMNATTIATRTEAMEVHHPERKVHENLMVEVVENTTVKIAMAADKLFQQPQKVTKSNQGREESRRLFPYLFPEGRCCIAARSSGWGRTTTFKNKKKCFGFRFFFGAGLSFGFCNKASEASSFS